MVSKKVILIVLAVAITGIALLYSLTNTQPQGEKLVVYNNFAYYDGNIRISSTNTSFELLEGVERDSVRLRVANGYVVSQHIVEANKTTEEDLMKSYIGKVISVFDENGKEITGTLLKFDGKAYIQSSSGLYILIPKYTFLPNFSGAINDTNTSIVFVINSSIPTSGRLSYLVESIGWSPVYTLYLYDKGGTLSLYGIVDNRAQDYNNVNLSLFYGQVQKHSRKYYPYKYSESGSYAIKASVLAPEYTPSAISEYYKFDLGNVALPKGQTQFNLMEKNVNTIKKTYEMNVNSYSSDYSALIIKLTINNSEVNGLGIPLPSGLVRVMNAEGFLGESYLSETPKDKEAKFTIGNAFDVIGQSKLVSQSEENVINCKLQNMDARYASLCGNSKDYVYATTYTYETTVKNKKTDDADIVLIYNPYGEWIIIDETLPHEKVSQNEVNWKFNLPPGSERTTRFSIVMKSRG